MSTGAGESLPAEAHEDVPGLFAEHAIAYGALVAAMLGAWQRGVARRLVGVLLAATGLVFATLLLSFGSVAAAWDTDYRWVVLLSVTGFYLLVAGVGVWLLIQKSHAPPPFELLGDELRKDVRLLSAALRGLQR